jgi:hypothetical protein
MKQGLSLVELAEKIEANKARKRDVLVDTRETTILTTAEGGSTLHLPDGTELDVMQHTHRQLGGRLKIRADFYDRLRNDHPELHTTMVNGLLREQDGQFKPGKYMVRTYTDGGQDGRGVARAFLSDRYRRVDNDHIAETVLPVLLGLKDTGHDVTFPSCAITDTNLYIKAVIPTVSYDLNEFIDPRKHVAVNDIVQAGIVIKNSEVGVGMFDVEQMVFRLVCQNGMITGSLLSKRHVGSRLTAGEDLTIYQDDTLAADDKAFMLKVRDTVKAAVDDTKFRVIVQEFAAAKDTPEMEKPIKAMEELGQRVGLTEGEGQSVLQHLLREGDLTKFGAVNAITRAAQDVDSHDRSTELEELAASDVLRMPAKDWEAVASAA